MGVVFFLRDSINLFSSCNCLGKYPVSFYTGSHLLHLIQFYTSRSTLKSLKSQEIISSHLQKSWFDSITTEMFPESPLNTSYEVVGVTNN